MIRMQRARLLAASAVLVVATQGLTACGTLLYLPSDAVNEDVDVTSDAELLEQITVSIESCDGEQVAGAVTNKATSSAEVELTFQLDDGVNPSSLTLTVEVPAGATQEFTSENTAGINPILGCSGTVEAARITE